MEDGEETAEEADNRQMTKVEIKSSADTNMKSDKSSIKLGTKSDTKSNIGSEIMFEEQQVRVTSPQESIQIMSDLPGTEIDQNLEPVKSVSKNMGDSLGGEKMSEKADNLPGPVRSRCKPRSRDPRRCQKQFREMIGKHEMKNEELGKKEGNLRERLEMLECSMPAVMVWNIWRMAQGAPVPNIRRVVEKQFQGFAGGCMPCPSTPSQHYDCRVRQVEAERKQAQRRADEARALWAEKEFALGEQKKKLGEAKKIQALHKERIDKLRKQVQEVQELRQRETEDNSCETGECGEIKCKQMWLGDVASTTSVKSTDLECLARLEDLAEAELCMKRHISELERREETYMRTLQQADELWSKMEGDTASTMSALQEQLDLKTSANQQLADKVCSLEDTIENLNRKLANCANELGKYVGIESLDAIIGFDDGHAQVADKDTLAKVGTIDEGTLAEKSGVDSKYQMTDKNDKDKDTLAKVGTDDKDTLAEVENLDKIVGFDDGHAQVADKNTLAKIGDVDKGTLAEGAEVDSKYQMTDKGDKDKDTLAKVGTDDKDTFAEVEGLDKIVGFEDGHAQVADKDILAKAGAMDKGTLAEREGVDSKYQMTDEDQIPCEDDISCKGYEEEDEDGTPCDDDSSCQGFQYDTDKEDELFSDDFELRDQIQPQIQKLKTYDDKEKEENLQPIVKVTPDETNLRSTDQEEPIIEEHQMEKGKEPGERESRKRKSESVKSESFKSVSDDQNVDENRPQDDPKRIVAPDDVPVPKEELKAWLETTTDVQKTISIPPEEIKEVQRIIEKISEPIVEDDGRIEPRDEKIEETDENFEETIEQFEPYNDQFQEINEQIGQINEKLDKLYEKFDQLNQKFEQPIEKFEQPIEEFELPKEQLDEDDEIFEESKEQFEQSEEQFEEPKKFEETEEKIKQPEEQFEKYNEQFEQINEKLDQLYEKFDQLNEKLEQSDKRLETDKIPEEKFEQSVENFELAKEQFDEVDEIFEEPKKEFEQPQEQFEQPEKKLEQPEEKFEQPEENFEQPKEQFDQFNEQFEQVNNKLDQLYEKFDQLNEKLEQCTKKLEQSDHIQSDEKKITDSTDDGIEEKDKNLLVSKEDKVVEEIKREITDDEKEEENETKEESNVELEPEENAEKGKSHEAEKEIGKNESGDLLLQDHSLDDKEDEIELGSEEKEVLSESREKEDELRIAGEKDELAERPIIILEEVEEDREKAISGQKSQIMIESSSSIPEVEAVIVQGAVTSSADSFIKNIEKPEPEAEIPKIPMENKLKEKAVDKLSVTDSECLCEPERISKQDEPKYLPKVVLSEELEERKESFCICENEVSREKTKPYPKLIIIKRTICKRPDQVSISSGSVELGGKDKKRKLSQIKVKDESIGTVVSVGLQTEKKIRKQPSPSGKIKKEHNLGSDYFSSCSENLNNESWRKAEEKVREKDGKTSKSESRCIICKRAVSLKDAVDIGSNVQTALIQKLIGFQSEINTCCTCEQQENSNSKIRAEETIEFDGEGKPFCPGNNASGQLIKGEIVKDVTINSQIGIYQKLHKSREKSDQSCLVKLIKSKVGYKEDRKKLDGEFEEKKTKSSCEPWLNVKHDNQRFSNQDYECICEERDEKSNRQKTQFREKKLSKCHCDDSD